MPRPFTAAMAAEISGNYIRPAFFLQMHFTSGDIFVWSGYGTVNWNGHAWQGIGDLGQISGIEESSDVKANNVTFTLTGIPSDLLGQALNETRQGYAVQLWFGCIIEYPNLLIRSEEFDNAAWVKNGGATATANTTANPVTGLIDADTVSNTANVSSFLTQTNSLVNGLQYALSIYAKPLSGTGVIAIEHSLNGAFHVAMFNTITGVASGADADITPSMLSLGNGWYECQVIIDVPSAGANRISAFYIGNYGPTPTPTSLALWGAQLTQGNKVRDYNRTFDVAGSEVLADPLKCFAGRMDIPLIEEGAQTSTISITVENILVDLQRSRLRTYTHADQQIDYPGDLGFEYVSTLQDWNGTWGKPGSGHHAPIDRSQLPPRPPRGGAGGGGGRGPLGG